MKKLIKLFLFSALLLPICGFSQRKVYFNDKAEVVDSTATYATYDVVTPKPDGWVYVKKYNKKGSLREAGAYSFYAPEEGKMDAEGQHKHYRDDGSFWFFETYKSGKQDGELRSFYPGKQLKRIERYENGVFIGGESFKEDSTSIPFTPFQVQPSFPGGEQALLRFLLTNVSYPPDARDNNIQGTVVVRFVVNKDGSISDIDVMKEVGGGCSKEAVRVVKKMPAWKPGMEDDQPVKVRYTLPIRFRLG